MSMWLRWRIMIILRRVCLVWQTNFIIPTSTSTRPDPPHPFPFTTSLSRQNDPPTPPKAPRRPHPRTYSHSHSHPHPAAHADPRAGRQLRPADGAARRQGTTVGRDRPQVAADAAAVRGGGGRGDAGHLQLPEIVEQRGQQHAVCAADVAAGAGHPRRRDLLRAADPVDQRRDEPAAWAD